MKPARLIWVLWCLLWVLIWCGLFFHDLAAFGRCQQINSVTSSLTGVTLYDCGPRPWPWLAAAVASGLAVWLPVGAEPWRDWRDRYAPSRQADRLGR